MCPLLTAGVLKSNAVDAAKAVDLVNEPAVEAFEAMPCQGEACAFWFTIADEHGHKTKDGNCAINLTAAALSQVAINTNKSPNLVKKA